MENNKPTTIVIFGGSGDLTQRKLIPGLFNLFIKGRLPQPLQIIGYARTEWETTDFRREMVSSCRGFCGKDVDSDQLEKFADQLHYMKGDLTITDDYKRLDDLCSTVEDYRDANRLYYLAIPPRFFGEVIRQLGQAGMASEESGWRRVIVEKPFGKDLASAQALNKEVHQVLGEHQIYRIDHYLAKETVQNLLIFRFGNVIFEPLWNRNYIDHVQITAVESVDVGRRAGYYDQAGVARDMFQNHLMQLLALVAMEPPASFEGNAIRNEKVKVLASVNPFEKHEMATETVRAQYEGYLEAPDVAEGSQTPTFAAVRLFIDNWRWKGVPFYLRSGKALKRKATEIIIQFKAPPHMMFPLADGEQISPNILAICIQPDEGIHLRFEAKVPDTDAGMRSVDMNFHYSDDFAGIDLPEAYEKLLLEALEGDPALFTRADGIEYAWQIMDPIIRFWEETGEPKMASYPRESWGPVESDRLLSQDGREWHNGCCDHD